MKGLSKRVDFPRGTRVWLKIRACGRLKDRREIVGIGEGRDREPLGVCFRGDLMQFGRWL